MQIELTTPEEVLMNNSDFKLVILHIEHALKQGYITTDPCNGWGEHIRVDINIPEWMQPWIDKIYARAGWDTIVYKFFDRAMFMIPGR